MIAQWLLRKPLEMATRHIYGLDVDAVPDT